jgi:hypothetical protein
MLICVFINLLRVEIRGGLQLNAGIFPAQVNVALASEIASVKD